MPCWSGTRGLRSDQPRSKHGDSEKIRPGLQSKARPENIFIMTQHQILKRGKKIVASKKLTTMLVREAGLEPTQHGAMGVENTIFP